jgi:PAS domain S-box-containing protein
VNPPTASATWRVLLIEDNPGDARLLQEYLEDPAGGPFVVRHFETLQDGLASLAQDGADLVLLDLSLPDSSGLESFRKLHEVAPQLPIIVLSGLNDENVAIEALHQGAQDYLVKGHVDTRLLVRAMRYAIERKRAEEELANERDLFHSLLDNLPDRIYFKNQKSEFIKISRAVARQFKLDHPRDAIGRTDLEFFAPEHARDALADEQKVMRTGEALLNKIEQETLPDGTTTWALTSKLPLRDRNGRIIGNFGISRDITRMKQMEDQLAHERNLLRSIIDHLPDYVYVKDLAGRYILDNPAHCEAIGAGSVDQVKGKTARDFFPHELADRFAADDQRVMQSGESMLNREELVIDRHGHRAWHATTKVPLRNPAGRIIGLVGISRDITERRQFEERLRETNTDLARHKEGLQAALTDLQASHEELKATQSLLIQAEKLQSVGRLAAGVAHEVKNPLAVLRMGLDYLNQNLPADDPSNRSVLKDMGDAIQRADGIIMGLLDFSVPHAMDLHAEDLNSLIEQSLGLVRHETESARRPICVELQLAESLPRARVDRNKVKQVLVNLLTNAAHAMPDGGTLTVRSQLRQLVPSDLDHDDGARGPDRLHAGQSVAVVEILDTGAGIPPDQLVRVFDPFFTTKPTGKGTGLGLTVTKKIIELHGGAIHVQNRPEGGVAVTLTFKL